jgi:hypothetical protein
MRKDCKRLLGQDLEIHIFAVSGVLLVLTVWLYIVTYLVCVCDYRRGMDWIHTTRKYKHSQRYR